MIRNSYKHSIDELLYITTCTQFIQRYQIQFNYISILFSSSFSVLHIDKRYLLKVSNQQSQVNIVNQEDNWYWWGKYLTMSQIAKLASNARTPMGGITIVFTSEDVGVEGFCVNQCAVHGSDQSSGKTFIWVGNSKSQCQVNVHGLSTNHCMVHRHHHCCLRMAMLELMAWR
jgi:Phosphate-induced protein 1 conserved region